MKVKVGDKVRACYDEKAELATVLEVIAEDGQPDMVKIRFLEGDNKGWQAIRPASGIAIIRENK